MSNQNSRSNKLTQEQALNALQLTGGQEILSEEAKKTPTVQQPIGNDEPVIAWVKPSALMHAPQLLGLTLSLLATLPLAIFAFELLALAIFAQLFFGAKLGLAELQRHTTIYKVTNKRFALKTGFFREQSGYAMLWAIQSTRVEAPLLVRLMGKALLQMGYRDRDPNIASISIHFRDGKVLPLEGIENGAMFAELIEKAARPERANLDNRGLLIGGAPTAGLEPWLIDPESPQTQNTKFW